MLGCGSFAQHDKAASDSSDGDRTKKVPWYTQASGDASVAPLLSNCSTLFRARILDTRKNWRNLDVNIELLDTFPERILDTKKLVIF